MRVGDIFVSKSLLYASNTVSQSTIATGTTINFGTAIRRCGCDVKMSGGNVVVAGYGYYDINVNLTFTAGGAGTVLIQILKDGTVVPGAAASITTVDSTTYAVSIPCIIRSSCCCESSLSVVVSGVTGAIANASIVVDKL